jgi:hypothetical protein
MDELAGFEQGVMAQAPPGAVLVGASVSRDDHYGVALTLLPGPNYLMDDVLVRRAEKWELHVGGSGGGFQWSLLEDDRGVLRYEEEAPESASVARVAYLGQEYRVPVPYGHFLFVAWDAPAPSRDAPTEGRPTLIGFD